MVAPFIPPALCETVPNLTVTHDQSGSQEEADCTLDCFQRWGEGCHQGKLKRVLRGSQVNNNRETERLKG